MQEIKIALVAALAGVADAIWDTQAPFGQDYPYILFQYIGGGDENLTLLNTRNELWQVKAVSDDHSQAESLAAAIRQALHQQTLSLSGHLGTSQTESLWRVENAFGVAVYHAGGLFRIRWYEA